LGDRDVVRYASSVPRDGRDIVPYDSTLTPEPLQGGQRRSPLRAMGGTGVHHRNDRDVVHYARTKKAGVLVDK